MKKNIYICVTELLCCTAEINTMLKITYTSISKKKTLELKNKKIPIGNRHENSHGEDESAGQLATSPRALARVLRESQFHGSPRRGHLPPK